MQIAKPKLKTLSKAAAVICAAAVLMGAGQASARLDELVVDGAPYVSPPPVAVSLQRSFYEVKPGDTLTDIARKNRLSVETLVAVNSLQNPDSIKAGQILKVPSDCAVHRVQKGETLWDIARAYQADVNEISARNRLANIDKIFVGQQLFIPCRPAAEQAFSSRGMLDLLSWPVVGAVTSPFGIRDGKPHEGIDIAVEEGTPIRAAAPGRVVFAGPRGTYGLAVIIDHGRGVRTLYAHCSKILVAEGSPVSAATVVALAGSTGRSSGPHLHLEVLKDGMPIDPLPLLEQEIYYG
ncbi:MAG TPA: M23 family metallopeptidase [Bacillota bacterium]|nr:M23 family metallopeptidase [Bacillota bacterium]